jgi:hypothetical protein
MYPFGYRYASERKAGSEGGRSEDARVLKASFESVDVDLRRGATCYSDGGRI